MFECRKTTVLARMISGRFRSEYLTRHWSTNKQGFCLAETCVEVLGDLEHLLIHCPALSVVRARLWDMFFSNSVQFPALYSFLLCLEKSDPTTQIQFILDPSAFPDIAEMWDLFGQQVIDHIYYLTRTYAYYLFRQKQIFLGLWQNNNLKQIKSMRRDKNMTIAPNYDQINSISHVSGLPRDVMQQTSNSTQIASQFQPSHNQNKLVL